MLLQFRSVCYTHTMLPFKYHLCARKASAWWCGVGGGDFPGNKVEVG